MDPLKYSDMSWNHLSLSYLTRCLKMSDRRKLQGNTPRFQFRQ
jgi:hypothetical protein